MVFESSSRMKVEVGPMEQNHDATILEGEERESLWNQIVSFSKLWSVSRKTTREIPCILKVWNQLIECYGFPNNKSVQGDCMK